MFRKKTVFIVGAGCSAEFGLPVGPQLLDNMYRTLNDTAGDRFDQVYDAFLRSGIAGSNQNFEQRRRQFISGLSTAPSIDQYLDFHRADPGVVMLGKCALAAEILHAEAESQLREEIADAPLPDLWLRRLLYLMMDSTDRSAPEAVFNNLSFISFNYDRTIEVFFRRAIPALVHCSTDETDELLKRLFVWHPYGTVGGSNLGSPGIAPKAAFSERRIHPEDVLAAAKQLRTFTEGAGDELERSEMHAVLSVAEQIVFIGFSYLEANMRLLKLGGSGTGASPIFGTVFGLPEPSVEIAHRLIVASFGPDEEPNRIDHRIHLHPLTARDFIWQYGQTLRS